MPQPSNKDLLSIEKALDVAQEEYLKNGNDLHWTADVQRQVKENRLSLVLQRHF